MMMLSNNKTKISIKNLGWLLWLGGIFSPTFTQPVDFPGYAYITYLNIDASNPAIIYAATLGAGLYKSDNRGEVWMPLNKKANIRKYYVVELNPHNSQEMIAGGLNSGVWYSSDSGATWHFAGLDDTTTVCHLSIDPAWPQRVFVLTPQGIYRTENILSRKWQMVFDFPQYLKDTYDLTDISDYLFDRWQKISINPHNPYEIYCACTIGGYFYSNDGGESWERILISDTRSTGRVDWVLFHPIYPKIIYTATHHHGIYKSFNGGKSWVTLSRGIAPQRRMQYYGAYVISGLILDPSQPDVLYTGGDYLNWKSSDGGISWHLLGKTLTCEYTRSFVVDPANSNIVYAGTNIGVYRSDDGGATWQPKNNGFPRLELVRSFPVRFQGEDFEFATDKFQRFVYRRLVTQQSAWQPMSRLLYDYAIDSLYYEATSQKLVIISPQSEAPIISEDGGFTWKVPQIEWGPLKSPVKTASFDGNRNHPDFWTIDIDLPGEVVFSDSLIDRQNALTPYINLWIVSETYPVDGSQPLWQHPLDDYLRATIQIPKSAILPDQPYLLYAEVRDFQQNCQTGFAKFIPRYSTTIQIPLSNQSLLPVFETPGTWSQPTANLILPNYPNPFSNITMIPFKVVQSGFAQINVYNLLGQQVMQLAHRWFEPGRYRIQCKVPLELGSGIYVVGLKMKDGMVSRKMMVVK